MDAGSELNSGIVRWSKPYGRQARIWKNVWKHRLEKLQMLRES